MALECAHCGTRCDDDATRCPRCLRTTHLVAVAAAPPRRRSAWPFAAGALLLLAGVGAAVFLRRPLASGPAVPASVAPAAADPLALTGSELSALVSRARGESDAVARARLVASAVHDRRHAPLVEEDEPTPPPRAPDLIWRLMPSADTRMTELDLARLVAAVLRAAGDENAAVAERTAPPRADDVMDASGLRGSYVVVTGDHVIEVTQGTLVGKGTVRHRALGAAALAGAVSAQAALELAATGGARDRAIEYANAAVDAWGDAPPPLAARARVWLSIGGTSGLAEAERDLRAAVALRDDAALHMLLARVALLQSDLEGASREALRASTMAPAWGTPAVALAALRPVIEQLDAGAVDACALLRQAHAPWTDDAYALCDRGAAEAVRGASARRLLERTRDPLRAAYAAAALPPGSVSLDTHITRSDRREGASWLLLLGRPELAAPLLGIAADAAVP